MFGHRPYNLKIEPRENLFVSFGAFGEGMHFLNRFTNEIWAKTKTKTIINLGFHNYHHSFPFDYSTSEMGWKLNITTFFIDSMARIGQAFDLRRFPQDKIDQRKLRIASLSHH